MTDPKDFKSVSAGVIIAIDVKHLRSYVFVKCLTNVVNNLICIQSNASNQSYSVENTFASCSTCITNEKLYVPFNVNTSFIVNCSLWLILNNELFNKKKCSEAKNALQTTSDRKSFLMRFDSCFSSENAFRQCSHQGAGRYWFSRLTLWWESCQILMKTVLNIILPDL